MIAHSSGGTRPLARTAAALRRPAATFGRGDNLSCCQVNPVHRLSVTRQLGGGAEDTSSPFETLLVTSTSLSPAFKRRPAAPPRSTLFRMRTPRVELPQLSRAP